MDYKEKYERIVQKCKELYDAGNTLTKIQMGIVCPELRESEDERIRKGLIDIFNSALGQDFLQRKARLDRNKVIAYLEKQKEQSKVGLGKYSEEENLAYRLNWVMQDYYKAGEDEEEREHRLKCYKLFWDALEDENFFEQKEQKPTLKFKVGDKIHLIDGTSPNYEDDCITIREIGTINYIGEFKEGYVPIKEQNKWELVKEQKPTILEVFGFKVGDAVRLKDGEGRKHIIKSFEEVEGIYGSNFYLVEFEDNSARDGIFPGEDYPNGYYTQMEKFEKEQKPAERNYDNRIQYDSVKSGIESFASMYSFNIESKLFPQLAKEQQQLWREEIERAVIAGGEYGIEISRDKRYKENKTIEWSEEDEKLLDFWLDVIDRNDWRMDENFCKASREFINRLKSLRPQSSSQSNTNHTVWHNASEEKPTKLPIIHIWYHGNRVDAVTHEDTCLQAELDDINFQPDDKWAYVEDLLNVQSHWKPSEQEKGAIRTAIYVLTEERNFPKTAAQLQNILDVFKGEESRKDWKPSEEQMEALKAAMDRNDSIGYNLGQLYEQLKKL